MTAYSEFKGGRFGQIVLIFRDTRGALLVKLAGEDVNRLRGLAPLVAPHNRLDRQPTDVSKGSPEMQLQFRLYRDVCGVPVK